MYSPINNKPPTLPIIFFIGIKESGKVKIDEPHAFLEFVRIIHNKIPNRIVLNTFFFKYFLQLLKDCERHKGKIIVNHAPA